MNFLKTIFPFIITLALWRLSHGIWNPCGILALAPIFYYSFISIRKYFMPFALLMCFLLDRNFGTLLFWTIYYCAFSAANGLQSFVILPKQKLSGFYIFAGFAALGFMMLGVPGTIGTGSWAPLASSAWMTAWTIALYLPLSMGFRMIGGGDDRS